jgi:putative pre-16S rRNA nuclease
MSKIMAIDYGDKRIGLAMTDEMKTMAFPYKTIEAGKNIVHSVEKLAEIISKEPFTVEKIIIGLPLMLSGKESDMTKKVREFGLLLEDKVKIEVEYVDERLTSKAADASMRDMKLNRKKRTKNLDTISAVFILEAYLARHF